MRHRYKWTLNLIHIFDIFVKQTKNVLLFYRFCDAGCKMWFEYELKRWRYFGKCMLCRDNLWVWARGLFYIFSFFLWVWTLSWFNFSSSYLWGFLADTQGRRSVIRPTLLAAFLITIASSFAQNIYQLAAMRFLNGFL